MYRNYGVQDIKHVQFKDDPDYRGFGLERFYCTCTYIRIHIYIHID